MLKCESIMMLAPTSAAQAAKPALKFCARARLRQHSSSTKVDLEAAMVES
jgi:hypothetical protein